MSAQVGVPQVLALIADLARLHLEKHGRIPDVIVAAGGTALALRGVRPLSPDVDLYVPEADDDIVASVLQERRAKFGPDFRLDVTPVDTVWGKIAVRDIDGSPIVSEIDVAGRNIPVRALSLETLYVLKAAAGRAKDMEDLSFIAPHVQMSNVIERANEMLRWFGDRSQLPEYAERLSRTLARNFGRPVEEIDTSLKLPEVVRLQAAELRRVANVRMAIVLAPAIRNAAATIRPDPERPDQLIVDLAADASGPQKEIAASRPDIVTTVAADILEKTAPDKFKEWRAAGQSPSPRKSG